MNLKEKIKTIVTAISSADALIITAGAGIGVDSGLPDFRGNQGFWNAYPALGAKALEFTDIASPSAFENDPRLAWGFYGHRLNLYRKTVPHDGFKMLKEMGEDMSGGYFVYTSNVDGQFQKAGFSPDKIVEIHGSIHTLQCVKDCQSELFPAEQIFNKNDEPITNDVDCQLVSDLPKCPLCQALLRPNILMFDDWYWDDQVLNIQKQRYHTWLNQQSRKVIIEIGAGTKIPSVRYHGEQYLSGGKEDTFIRINPTEAETENETAVSLPMPALEAISFIYQAWKST